MKAMIRTGLSALALCALLVPLALPVAAQDSARAPAATTPAYQVTGTVKDSAGAPVPEAEVTLIERATTLRRPVATDAQGRFELRDVPAGRLTVRVRRCQPTVWVDGQRIPGAELDDVIQPNDIGGIEFYPSSSGIPPQYLDPSNRLCGLILVWTRSQ